MLRYGMVESSIASLQHWMICNYLTMKIATTLVAAATLLAPTAAFTSPKQATAAPLTVSLAYTLPQENGLWAPHTSHPDTRHTILPQELGVWSTSPPAGYVPPHTSHIDTRKKILDQESKGIWPTTPPPGWVCKFVSRSLLLNSSLLMASMAMCL
jgi:hypothetical protein